MAGHSKWAQIKRKKAAVDAKRGKVFSRLAKEITVAARLGGGNPDGNARLRTVIEKAKEANMPQENVLRAIKKGTGELPGTIYEEVTYEGYGPGGVAVLIESLTDNKNRTVAEIRHLISKNGGNLGEAGCVSWMFEKKGVILILKGATDEDTLLGVGLEAGAEDIKNDPKEDHYEVMTSPENMLEIKDAIEKEGIPLLSAELTMIPQTYVTLDAKTADQMMKLIDVLEDSDEVQDLYTNFDIPEDLLLASTE